MEQRTRTRNRRATVGFRSGSRGQGSDSPMKPQGPVLNLLHRAIVRIKWEKVYCPELLGNKKTIKKAGGLLPPRAPQKAVVRSPCGKKRGISRRTERATRVRDQMLASSVAILFGGPANVAGTDCSPHWGGSEWNFPQEPLGEPNKVVVLECLPEGKGESSLG